MNLYLLFTAILATFVTAAPFNDSGAQVSPQTVTVSLGNAKQGIGDLVGSALYGSVYQVLLDLCDPISGCNTGDSPWIPINYHSGTFIKRAYLIVRVVKAAYKTDTMRRLLIGQVSGTLQAMSEDKKNCANTYCNIGNRVTVNTTAGDYLDVSFSSPTATEGKFDCFAIIEQTDKYLQSLIPEFKAVYGTDVYRNVFCRNNEVTRREN